MIEVKLLTYGDTARKTQAATSNGRTGATACKRAIQIRNREMSRKRCWPNQGDLAGGLGQSLI